MTTDHLKRSKLWRAVVGNKETPPSTVAMASVQCDVNHRLCRLSVTKTATLNGDLV